MQEYEELRLHNKVSQGLAKWCDEESNRVKASKLYKMIFKYEKLWLKHHDTKNSKGKWVKVSLFKK
jgi:hypothetical protein